MANYFNLRKFAYWDTSYILRDKNRPDYRKNSIIVKLIQELSEYESKVLNDKWSKDLWYNHVIAGQTQGSGGFLTSDMGYLRGAFHDVAEKIKKGEIDASSISIHLKKIKELLNKLMWHYNNKADRTNVNRLEQSLHWCAQMHNEMINVIVQAPD